MVSVVLTEKQRGGTAPTDTGSVNVNQLYVVDVEDRKSGKVSAVYVFNNHDAALRCRHALGMDHNHLRGCVVSDDWLDGSPVRAAPSQS